MRAKWERFGEFLSGLPAARCLRVAVLIWAVYAGIIVTLVAVNPSGRSATLEYQRATANWWASKTLYAGKNRYLYLPHFAVFYTPYELLPDRVGEPLWRLTCMGLLAWALWAAAARLAPAHREAVFLVATTLILPSTFASARNGQVNMPLAALFVLIALALARERWWTAAVFLALTLVFKPIAIAPILLCAAVYPRLRLPMLASLAIAAAIPLAHPNPAYAFGEFGAFVAKLQSAGKPTGHSWCDFAGMLRVFGLDLPSTAQLGLRALAGLLALGLCWRVVRKADRRPPARREDDAGGTASTSAGVPDALLQAFTVLLVSTVYLMLFNPRTETNSYVMLGAFAAVWAGVEWIVFRRNSRAAWLVLLCVLLGTENYGWPIFPLTNLWAKALAASALGAWLALRIIKSPPGCPVLMEVTPLAVSGHPAHHA